MQSPSSDSSSTKHEKGRILVGKAHATVIPQINTTPPAMGFPPTLGIA
ncbi:hypothetical protein [Neisseria sicca]|nr:hypothetical protein [Neisseria sicca]MBF1285415.1 hypothetical protein [Neisseria sp.]